MGNRFREKVVEEGLENSNSEFGGWSPEVSVSDLQPPTSELNKPPTSDLKSGLRPPTSELKKGDKAARGIGRVLGGDVLADKLVLKQIPLVLLCLIYLLLIVGNRYRVESLSREKAATEERINYLREHRIQMQKQYQKSVMISQIAEDLNGTGVGITSGPPYEIER